MKAQSTRENSELIEKIKSAIDVLSELHGENYSDQDLNREDWGYIMEDIHCSRLEFNEEEYSLQDHEAAMAACSYLMENA